MKIIKLNATSSTNVYLKDLMLSSAVKDFTVVTAKKQTNGRGQMGTSWNAEDGKNLTFSVLKRFDNFSIDNQFLLSICVSLSVYKTLYDLKVPNLTIKWPNDILSGTSKICGILIENSLSGSKIQTSIIGIGLNVNQIIFNNLLNVSSLKLLLGKSINLEEVLQFLLKDLQEYLFSIENKGAQEFWPIYESRLFRVNKPSTFEDVNGNFIMGFIRGVSSQGKLIVELEDSVIKEYGLKEVKLKY